MLDRFDTPFFKDPNYMKKQRRKHTITSIIISSSFLFLMSIVLFVMMSEAKSEQVVNESYLGKSVTINEESLMIVDYSNLRDTYILENGKEINQKLVDKLVNN